MGKYLSSTRVLIIGFGSLGRWHLKGLELARLDLQVDVVDPDPRALRSGDDFTERVISPSLAAKVRKWHSLEACLSENNSHFDLAIISTCAPGRFNVVQALVKSCVVKHFIIEKPIETSVVNINNMRELLAGKSVFVNFPRRLMPWQKQLKKNISKFKSLDCSVKYQQLAIACNASHFIDLINWWTGQLPLSVCLQENNSNWHPSKRDGYWDFFGEALIKFDGGASLTLVSLNNSVQNTIVIESETEETCVIKEERGSAKFSSGNTICGENLPQSKLSGLLLESLIEFGTCDLTVFEIAAASNLLLTDALNHSWEKKWDGQIAPNLHFT